jgi:hypothetical protein
MAAKTLREAICNATHDKGIDLTEDQIRCLEGELRDFFIHQISRVNGPPPHDGTELEKVEWQLEETVLLGLFHSVFKDVSSYQGTKQ